MKIAVYTICKNEEKHAERFMSCLAEADQVIITDTGSTDQTVTALQDLGATVKSASVLPWRFDLARNVSLSFVPDDVDVCVCIDLDEVLEPGWRQAIEEAWTPQTTRLRYKYCWSHNPDSTPGTTFWYDKIHKRSGYRWVKPVHEILQHQGEERQATSDKLVLHHWPDASKSRGSYLPLLRLAVAEEPQDDRSSHYLGRELTFYNLHDEAIAELQRHLSLPSAVWAPERAASMRLISKSYLAKGDMALAASWALRACAEAPGEREPWVELARLSYQRGDWPLAYGAARKCLEIVERPMSYICDPHAWGELPYDLLAIAAYNLGHIDEARQAAAEAVGRNPTDKRLQANLDFLSRWN